MPTQLVVVDSFRSEDESFKKLFVVVVVVSTPRKSVGIAVGGFAGEERGFVRMRVVDFEGEFEAGRRSRRRGI